MELKTKNLKLLYAKIVIISVIILAILLPQILGSTEIPVSDGVLNSIDSIGTLTAAIIKGDADSSAAKELFEGTAVSEYDSRDKAVKAVSSGEAGYLIVAEKNVPEIINSDSSLMVYPEALRVDETSAECDEYYAIVRKEDYAFGITGKTIEDVNDSSVHVAALTGTDAGFIINERFPDATVDYYNDNSSTCAALSAGQVQYFVGYAKNNDDILETYPQFAKLYQPLKLNLYCFGLPKTERGQQIKEQFDSFTAEIKLNGVYDDLQKKWNSGDESNYVIDNIDYTGENGVLKIVTCGSWVPNSFMHNDSLVGFFIEECCLFCDRYGYVPEFYTSSFADELAGVTTGQYDFVADTIEYSDERNESMNFTSPVLVQYNMLYTMADEVNVESVSKLDNFIASTRDRFTKNFISNGRYSTILHGLVTTILLSLLTAVIGTVLAGIICAMNLSKKVFFKALAQIYIKIMQGIPIVVLLLVLFYVVLAKAELSGFWVCVIAFSLDFSAYVAEIFRNGIEAVPEGQKRAAIALGFTESRSFFKVVLPQAVRHILPVFSGQVIAMVKTTCIAGYIAVQDLTKASDLIRGVTYDAFFPIIGAAVIYFLLSTILVLLLRVIEAKTDIKKRSRQPKGVNINAD